MTGESTIKARLSFNRIDEQTVATLKASQAFILRELPAILDRFYDHLAQFEETKALFKDSDQMMRAKQMQLKHWSIIAEGRFDESYEASVIRVGEVHNTLGVETRWYIGGYNFLISELVAVIARKLPAGRFDRSARERKVKLQAAIIRAALLDMDLAISVYLEAGKRDRRMTLDRLAQDFDKVIGEVAGTVASAATGLEAAATTLTHTADHTQKLSIMVASASEEASASVQSVASATEELTSSVAEISRQVHESSRIAGDAVKQAQQTDARIDELSQAASRIGDVVKLITAVAEQTNLLALNATIEAARAGDAGRGFAVVAQEVKNLAAQTAKATSDISTQITGMQAATQVSVTAIKEIGVTIARISEIATTIASAVEQQGAATQEISRSIQQAATGTGQVASNIAEVSTGAGETGSASSRVLSSAQALSAEGGKLKAEVAKFLETVRAA